MNLECINKGKFANLTQGTIYEGIEDGDLYVVVNNLGARARYAKKYFRVAPANAQPARTRPVTETVPATPAPAPAPVIRNLIDVVNIEVNVEDQIAIRLTAGQGVRAVNLQLSIDQSQISCGIQEISGISGIRRQVEDFVTRLQNNDRTMTGNTADLINRIMNEVFDAIRNDEENECAFYLLSDVVDNSNPVQTWLTGNAISVASAMNPNSSNQINLWTMRGSNTNG